MSKEERKNKQIEEDSDEDDSDDDYVPSDTDDKDDNQEELDDEDDLIINNDDSDKIVKSNELTEEERKKRADQLWADLMSLDKKPVNESSTLNSTEQQNSSSSNNSLSKTEKQNSSSKTIVTKIYDYAGEKVEVKEEIDNSKLSTSSKPNPLKRGLGINNLVANLGKKSKLSTLNKTKQDWDLFKKEEGIEDDLKRAKKDKNSFVERTAFLQRTDLRLFESEKSIRDKNRTRNQS